MTGRALIAAAVAAGCGHRGPEPALVEVRRAELVVGVEVTGMLEAVDSTDLKPPPLANVWNFKIANLAPEGAEVKAGDVVIGFDPSDQVRELETMTNEAAAAAKRLDKKRDDAAIARRDDGLKLAEAEAALRKAQLKADAPSELVGSIDQRLVQLDRDAAQLAVDAARTRAAQTERATAAELAQLADKAAYARERVAMLQAAIARMQVTAPRPGTVVYAVDEQGEKHKVGDNVWRMADVVQVVALGSMVGAGQVDEVDLARVAARQPVVLRLDALPDLQLRGTVAAIDPTVQARSRNDPSKIVKLRIAIDGHAAALRPGMRFRGQVEVERAPAVVQVPADAVFVTPSGPVAYRASAGGLERVAVVLGRRTASAIEIVRGLAPGEQVSRHDPGAAP